MVHLAQYNIGRLVAPREDPEVAEFMDELDRINALAETSPGYVWRAQSEEGNLTAYHLDDDPQLIPNLSVWTSVDALREYVYRSEHRDFLRRRREWFEPLGREYLVLWWIPEDHEPTLDEGRQRLEQLAADGPSPEAFTFKKVFDPEGAPT